MAFCRFQRIPRPFRFDGDMNQSGFIPFDERIVDTMIGLACAAKSHRIILAGPNSFEMFLELHRRGYPRVTTTRISRAPCGQHLARTFGQGARINPRRAGPFSQRRRHTRGLDWSAPNVHWVAQAGSEKTGLSDRFRYLLRKRHGPICATARLEPAREGGVRQ